jgi:hypothetical protein
VIVDHADPNQGWRWGEIDRAIDALPAGPIQSRQRMHFDALTLAAVLLQHGDRKPEQQRLACRSPLTLAAGDIHPLVEDDSHAFNLPVFFERLGATACEEPVLTVQDIGATFGGAGRTTNATTAKMNLKAWAARPVFHSARETNGGALPDCRGDLTVSMAAGAQSGASPRIGDAGRLFLLERLRRLTDEHLRSLMTAARVEQMNETHTWRDPRTGTGYTGVEAWIAAFKDKVSQIEARRCAP